MTADPGPKERLLRAAADLFARDGYAGASVRAVAARAGANVAAVSYHFGGKDHLYAAAVRLACRELEALAPCPQGEDGPAGAWWARLLGHELLAGGPHAADVVAAIRRSVRPGGSDLLAVAGLMAVAVSAQVGAAPADAEAACAAFDQARGTPPPPPQPE